MLVAALYDVHGNLPALEAVLEDIRWTAGQLLPAHQKLISDWPMTVRIEVEGLGTVLFCHATPGSETENFTRITPEEKLLPAFDLQDVDVVVCGHTHMQFDRMIGQVRVINAGSVGMPFGTPGAFWLLLGETIEFCHTEYDLKDAAERIAGTGYPHAEDFTGRLIEPPSEEKMLKVLG